MTISEEWAIATSQNFSSRVCPPIGFAQARVCPSPSLRLCWQRLRANDFACHFVEFRRKCRLPMWRFNSKEFLQTAEIKPGIMWSFRSGGVFICTDRKNILDGERHAAIP